MITCTCLVQAKQTPDQRQALLRPALEAFASRTFGQAADIRWIPVASGNGFTAARPSTSSIVSVTAPEALEQEKRAELLEELCGVWMSVTECSLDEIVAVISDPA